MPRSNPKPSDLGTMQRPRIWLAALVFCVSALLGLGISGVASWLLLDQAATAPTATSTQALVTPTSVYLLLGATTLMWVMAASAAWLVIGQLQRQAALLAESRERNRAIVDNMVDGAIHIDGNGGLVALNRAAEQMFGYASQRIRGQKLSTLLAPGDRTKIENLLRGENRRSKRNRLSGRARDVTGKRKNGNEFPLYLAISEVHTGGYTVYTAIARDMSETRSQMAELAKARDQALAADLAKSQFLAVMSHEIRTPMNGILGMLDLLRDGSLSQQQQEFLDTAEKSSNILLCIINDILDLSKIEAGKLDLQEIDFDLRTNVEEATTLVASDAVNKAIEIASFVERDVPEQVRGDPYRLRQILLNLLGNAVKFTHEGEILAHVSAQSDDNDGLLIRVQIRDTGIGIDPDIAKNLFQPFTQADATTTRRFGGTGLGLVISKRLVNLMGGEIGVDSKPNQGSTFWFTLRLAKSDTPIQQNNLDLNGVKMLIVDDNATNRLILEHYLGNWGAETSSVDGGANALLALQHALDANEPFALAILDMQMPEMDGLELAQRIKGNAATADTRLLMLSSLGYPGEDARRAGIGVSLMKPVRQVLLRDAVRKVLGMTQPTALIPATRREEPQLRLRAKVLVAEDNAVNQKVILMMLGRYGIEAEVAVNGKLAVEAVLRGRDYDLLFMDVQMPVMGGDEATRRIRALESEMNRTPLPIIAMTASASEKDREACIKAGMDDFISKPVHKKQLEAALLRWLPQRAELPPKLGDHAITL